MRDGQNSEKQQNSNQSIDRVEARLSEFSLEDLSRLTFRLADGQALDCWSSTAVQFQAYIQRFGTIEGVDTDSWSPFDRLDYLNGLLTYCGEKHRRFPFTLTAVNPLVEGSGDESESKKGTKEAVKEA